MRLNYDFLYGQAVSAETAVEYRGHEQHTGITGLRKLRGLRRWHSAGNGRTRRRRSSMPMQALEILLSSEGIHVLPVIAHLVMRTSVSIEKDQRSHQNQHHDRQ